MEKDGKNVKKELKMVHLQLTRQCNLHCRFCGQSHAEKPGSLCLSEWCDVIGRIHDYAPDATLVLWGGEPLLYPGFESVVRCAAHYGFVLELITNGTRIDRHAELLKMHFQRIYLSVDGPEAVHDSIRGAGAFARIRRNLAMLADRHGELVLMSVMAPENLDTLELLPFGLPVDRVILHELIYLTEAECAFHGADFGRKWRGNATDTYPAQLAAGLEKLKQKTFFLPVEFQPHFHGGFCREPYRHLHIGAEGETSFCTDFTDATLGNVRTHAIREIFEGAAAEEFRKHGNEPCCSHCSWKNTSETILQLSNIKKGEMQCAVEGNMEAVLL